MSALNVQKVMASLIRFPEDSVETIVAKLGSPEFSAQERRQIEAMEVDPYVRKYGYKLRYLRQVDAVRPMRLSRDFIDEDLLSQVYLDQFETSRETIDLDTIGVDVLEFCLTDAKAQKSLSTCDSFVRDLLSYERTKTALELKGIVENDPALPSGSLLRHNSFGLLDLSYDVPAVDKQKIKDPTARVVPRPQAMKIIVLAIDQHPYTRVFQIDATVETFLLAQRTAPESWQGELPPAYAPMVKVGLCKEIH